MIGFEDLPAELRHHIFFLAIICSNTSKLFFDHNFNISQYSRLEINPSYHRPARHTVQSLIKRTASDSCITALNLCLLNRTSQSDVIAVLGLVLERLEKDVVDFVIKSPSFRRCGRQGAFTYVTVKISHEYELQRRFAGVKAPSLLSPRHAPIHLQRDNAHTIVANKYQELAELELLRRNLESFPNSGSSEFDETSSKSVKAKRRTPFYPNKRELSGKKTRNGKPHGFGTDESRDETWLYPVPDDEASDLLAKIHEQAKKDSEIHET